MSEEGVEERRERRSGDGSGKHRRSKSEVSSSMCLYSVDEASRDRQPVLSESIQLPLSDNNRGNLCM